RAAVSKELWSLDHSPRPVESWRRALESADGNDDRVWLGRANSAILTGRFAAAADWLDRCLKRRPDALAVWRARLELAVQSDDEAGFWVAAERLPAESFASEELLTLRAWTATRQGDSVREIHELETLVRESPGQAAALERLALLRFEAGEKQKAEELHRSKAKIDQAQDELRKALLDSSLLN